MESFAFCGVVEKLDRVSKFSDIAATVGFLDIVERHLLGGWILFGRYPRFSMYGRFLRFSNLIPSQLG